MTASAHWSDDVLSFWFTELTQEQWWSSTPELDEQIRGRFLGVTRSASASDIGDLTQTPERALAAVIALDQFPRNMFRRTTAAFATDTKALQVTETAIAKGHNTALTATQRHFLYMPFMHAEDANAQARGLAAFTALGDADGLKAAIEHKAIIDRFGRFPHRNEALGRASTAEEIAYLDGAKRYGQ
jgi:uncharacterized protein (DUF924 family)